MQLKSDSFVYSPDTRDDDECRQCVRPVATQRWIFQEGETFYMCRVSFTWRHPDGASFSSGGGLISWERYLTRAERWSQHSYGRECVRQVDNLLVWGRVYNGGETFLYTVGRSCNLPLGGLLLYVAPIGGYLGPPVKSRPHVNFFYR